MKRTSAESGLLLTVLFFCTLSLIELLTDSPMPSPAEQLLLCSVLAVLGLIAAACLVLSR